MVKIITLYDFDSRHYGLKLIEELGGNPEGSIEEHLKLLQETDATKLLHLTNMFEEFIRYNVQRWFSSRLCIAVK